jgi:hypothetical protein
MSITAWQFEQLYGRKPRMTGTLDCAQARVWENAGYELVSVDAIGDDIRSWVVARGPADGVVLDAMEF